MIFFKKLKLLNTFLLATSCIISFNLSAEAETEVYTWVDKDGVVNYSDKPIPDGNIVELDPIATPNLSDAVNPNSPWEQEYQKTQKIKKEQALTKAENEQEKTAYCNKLKSDLAVYQQGGRIYTMQPDGTRDYQTQSDLTTKTKELTKLVKEKC